MRAKLGLWLVVALFVGVGLGFQQSCLAYARACTLRKLDPSALPARYYALGVRGGHLELLKFAAGDFPPPAAPADEQTSQEEEAAPPSGDYRADLEQVVAPRAGEEPLTFYLPRTRLAVLEGELNARLAASGGPRVEVRVLDNSTARQSQTLWLEVIEGTTADYSVYEGGKDKLVARRWARVGSAELGSVFASGLRTALLGWLGTLALAGVVSLLGGRKGPPE